jgi:Leu/Phe-tRNA-protein transferase
MLKIVLALHYEIDRLQKQQHFINREVANEHIKEWGVTNWGRVHFQEIEVTEE